MLKLAVIGAGPAGVSAALYARSRGLDVCIFEAEEVGGLIGKVSKVSHFASAVEGETGPEFAKRLKRQLEAAKIPVIYEKVTSLRRSAGSWLIQTEASEYEAEGVIAASGSSPKALPLELPSAVKLYHFGLGAEKEAEGRVAVMNGGSDGAVKEALYLARFAREVHIVQDQEKLLCIDEFRRALKAQDNIVLHLGSTLKSVRVSEDGRLKALELRGDDSGLIEAEDGLLLFALIGQAGNSSYLGDLCPTEGGFALLEGQKAAENLWLAGDLLVKGVRQVATAVSDGCLAGIEAAKALG